MTFDIAALFNSHGRLRTEQGGRFGSLDVVSPSALSKALLPWLDGQGMRYSIYLSRLALLCDGNPRPVDRAKLTEVLRGVLIDLLRSLDRPEATDTAAMLERREHGHAAYLARVLNEVTYAVPGLDRELNEALRLAVRDKQVERRRNSCGEPLTRDEWNAERRSSRQSEREVRIRFSRREIAALVDSLEPGRHTFPDVWKRYQGDLGRNDFYAALAEAVPAKKHAGVRYLVIQEPSPSALSSAT